MARMYLPKIYEKYKCLITNAVRIRGNQLMYLARTRRERGKGFSLNLHAKPKKNKTI